MKWLDALILMIAPHAALRTTPWYAIWEQQEKQSFRTVARISFLLAAIAYVAHYFLIDLPLNKQPQSWWFIYRFGMTALALIGFGLTFSTKFQFSRVFRWPMILAGVVFSYFQAYSMVWSSGIPYFYAIIIPVLVTLALRMTVVSSAFYLGIIFMLQWPFFKESQQNLSYIISAAVVGLVTVVMFRAKMSREVQMFLSEQMRIETQKKLIESEMELNEQIRAFLPMEIFGRIDSLMKHRKMTVIQAMDQVLRPQTKTIACIFSDIRGFTQQSKDLSGFVEQVALPNIRACTDLVESFRGIPRHIGDLVFSYFDLPVPQHNIKRALRCAAELIDKNRLLNQGLSESLQVKRYVLVSFGEAVVGNIGGMDASREITAMGTPANILSRIDVITKEPAIRGRIHPESLILTESAAKAALEVMPDLVLERIDLKAVSITIRDFPEEKNVWVIPLNELNRAVLFSAPDVVIGEMAA